MTPPTGPFGIWARRTDLDGALAAKLEEFGFGAVWIGGSPGGDLALVSELLDATTTLTVATGIINIWSDDATTIAESYHRIEAAHPGRFIVGIGVGHPEAIGRDYSHPYQAMEQYLDELDAFNVPQDQIVLAALGPKVLKLAADRSAGAHPYLTTPEHTRQAREIIGSTSGLYPEQRVVLEADPAAARAIGRPSTKPYLGLVNYLNNLRRLGFTDADFADGGSDALIDALVGWGTDQQVAARLQAHLDAGATHVAAQLLAPAGADPLPYYRRIAQALGLV
jgi:probable F420-dependent oxidoreductase